jgi:Protein of unknown function (DUF2867)
MISTLDSAALLLAGAAAGLIGSSGGITSLVSYSALLAVGLPALSANGGPTTSRWSGCWPGSALASQAELHGNASWPSIAPPLILVCLLRVGDPVDFWPVEQLEPGSRLLLAAELRIPGRLWLDFDVQPDADRSQIRQTTIFDPAGWRGLAYWSLLYPLHRRIFAAMLRGLRRATLAGP